MIFPQETAILAAGCFWGVEELFRQLPGVLDTDVGYTGGQLKNPTYRDICTGQTGHAEAVKITFDPTKVLYKEILIYFFKLHDPTTPNRQGNDVGEQYRSSIFYLNEEQKSEAALVISEITKLKVWPAPLVTQVVPAQTFYRAEDYHQDYLQKNPDGYTCHYLRW